MTISQLKKPVRSVLFGILAVLLTTGCTSTGGKHRRSAGGDNLSGGDGGKDEDGGARSESAYVSSKRATLINSLTNNQLTSYTINSSKAAQQVEKLPASAKDKKTLEGRLSAERLARKSVGQVLNTAKKIALLEMEKKPEAEIDDDVKLELALAAVNSRNFALAEYYLADISDSKNARVRAGAFNAMGVIALRDERIPEAVDFFKQALKAIGSYKPALLNLGFTALKGGDLQTAEKAFSGLQEDWFVQYGMISINRLEDNVGRAADLCDKVLKKESNHKAALANCGLLEFQNKSNYAKAKEYFNKSLKARGGEAGWDKKLERFLDLTAIEEHKIKSAAAAKKKTEKQDVKNDKNEKKVGGDK